MADALAWHVDLLSPVSKPALQGLLALAHGEDREKLGRILNGSAEQYKAWHKQSRCLLEVLEEFPNIQPPIGERWPVLTDLIRRYHIASLSVVAGCQISDQLLTSPIEGGHHVKTHADRSGSSSVNGLEWRLAYQWVLSADFYNAFRERANAGMC